MNTTRHKREKPSQESSLNDTLDAPLDELLAAAKSRYEVAFEPVKIGGHTLEILQLTNMGSYVEALAAQLTPGDSLELPFWAKIWRSSFLLSYFVQRLPAEGRSMLEIGAGVGLCGLFAAKHGFDVTLTDIHPDALLFMRINILKNGLQERARVASADFTQDRLGQRFDIVLGSEVLYKEDTYRPLCKFLLDHVADTPEAEIVLAKEFTRKATKFFNLAEREFNIKSQDIGYKSDTQAGDQEKHLCTIYRLSPKKITPPRIG
ncbi:Putative methyltransferase [Desulfocurvibacter africanus PCS]|uniref:Putative methyltransferase n=1 Tax=Desulfocurvibacter africanus PCS TaxID=1262666 RepID=M5Q343_DESAF|nr:methyltransferase [Desulfocurvibacter africanus]EMG37953.1 Putative methyltransferase [Desulfocurvibacter africanus PCS]